MAKKIIFPVKTFQIKGSALSEARRVIAVKNAKSIAGSVLTQAAKPGRSVKPKKVKKIAVSDTATGSGLVSFAVYSRKASSEPVRQKALKRA